jgi:hypothetical protein
MDELLPLFTDELLKSFFFVFLLKDIFDCTVVLVLEVALLAVEAV